MPQLKDLAELCRGHDLYIQTHNFPDPDAIASAFGLQKLLDAHGVPARIFYAGRIDKVSALKMLELFGITIYPYEELKQDMQETDYVICVDSQKNGGNITDYVPREVACIDHHPTFVEEEYLYRDVRITGACASMIAEYFKLEGLTPDSDTATALLYGLKMDTLQFSRGVTPLDIDMFRYLHPLCDHGKLARVERNNMEYTDLKAYGAAIENIEMYGKVGITYIDFSCPDALIGILSDFILALNEVEIAVVASRRNDGIKLSVRSENGGVHAGELIRSALGRLGSAGGHAAMAGGLIRKDKLPELGEYPRNRITALFLEALERGGFPVSR